MAFRRTKPVKIMPQIEARLDWQDELIRMLIDAGTDGIKQSKIAKRFDHWIEADDVWAKLEVMAEQHKVQKFKTSGRGRPATIWRATTLILKA